MDKNNKKKDRYFQTKLQKQTKMATDLDVLKEQLLQCDRRTQQFLQPLIVHPPVVQLLLSFVRDQNRWNITQHSWWIFFFVIFVLKNKLLLFCCWNRYFQEWLYDSQVQSILNRMKSQCENGLVDINNHFQTSFNKFHINKINLRFALIQNFTLRKQKR